MEYRFTMTRRLLAVAAFSLLALLALLFVLGIQIGQMMAPPAAAGSAPANPGKAELAVDRAVDRAFNALPHALPGSTAAR